MAAYYLCAKRDGTTFKIGALAFVTWCRENDIKIDAHPLRRLAQLEQFSGQKIKDWTMEDA